jgi:hypothetical protein
MLIIGCDFHTRYQQIAIMDEATGELIERCLDHESGEAGAHWLRSNQWGFYLSTPCWMHSKTKAVRPERFELLAFWFAVTRAELQQELPSLSLA